MKDWQRLTHLFSRFAGRNTLAWAYQQQHYSYDDLWHRALDIASLLLTQLPQNPTAQQPVIVYGHKAFDFIAAWWACLLCGCPIVPVESDNSPERVNNIASTVAAALLLNTTDSPVSVWPATQINLSDLPVARHDVRVYSEVLTATGQHLAPLTRPLLAYMMFSSGTTSQPKGIQITLGNLVNFVDWIAEDFPLTGTISGNVRYCFDVSLFELWLAWFFMQPLSILDYRELVNTRRVMAQHKALALSCWVSTPSMIRLYLLDANFSQTQLPQLQRFLFCGETLTKEIVTQLWQRFPGCEVVNTYGPTECTVAVSAVTITPDMISDPRPLPIGRARAGAQLSLLPSPHTTDRGELLISGACVGAGYLNATAGQNASFSLRQNERAYPRWQCCAAAA